MTTDLHADESTRHDVDNVEPEAAGQELSPVGAEDEGSNVFQVLGAQARTRSIAQLWVAALGGALDAGLLWWRHPMLGWLAAGCAAVAAYGAWGLLDRAVERRSVDPATTRETLAPLVGLRDLAAIAGTVAALWAVFWFMAVALGNWNH